jgi:4-amino-4-deoxychorismate lyase
VVQPVLALLADPPRLVDPATPVLRADDLGLARGESVFETLRIAGGRAAFVDLHLERLARSAARLALVLPGGWRELVELATGAYDGDDGVLRLTCSKGAPGAGPVGFALVTPVPVATVAARQHGVSAVTLTLGVPAALRTGAPWLLGGVKSTSYAVNMATLRAAEDAGAQDAIWTSTDGYVLEAPGTTAAVALALAPVPVDVRLGTVDELRAADEVMLLSSVRGVTPVVRLDGRELGTGPVTTAVRAAFEQAVLQG